MDAHFSKKARLVFSNRKEIRTFRQNLRKGKSVAMSISNMTESTSRTPKLVNK